MSGWPLRGKKMTPIRSTPYSAAHPLERGFNCYYFIIQEKISLQNFKCALYFLRKCQ